MRLMRFMLTMALLWALACSTVQAAPMYVLEAGSTVSQGQTTTVNVFIQDTTGMTDLSTVFATGAKITQTGGTGSVSALSRSDIMANPILNPNSPDFDSLTLFPFDDPSFGGTAGPGDIAGLYEGLGINYFPQDSQGRIFVGSFTLTGGNLGGVTLIAQGFGSDTNPTVGNDGVIDVAASAAITLQVVPEPVSMAVFGVAVAGAGAWGWRSRRRKPLQATA